MSLHLADSFAMMLSRDLGIDLGTSNLRVFQRGRGVVVREPSVVAYPKGLTTPRAYGQEAVRLIGRSPDTLDIVRPIRGGAIASYSASQDLLSHYLSNLGGGRPIWKPRAVVVVPSGITPVERQAVLDACRMAGARDAISIESPMAAALGLGLPITEAHGHMVVDIGGGTSDIAVISLGGIVVSDSARVGGDTFDEAIHRQIQRNHSMVIGDKTAEDIKLTIGTAWEGSEDLETEVKGRDMTDGMPKAVLVSSIETRIAINDQVGQIINRIRSVIERTPPELVNDIAQGGIWLTGGSALLRGLDQRIKFETGIPVHLSNDPELNVANGVGSALEHIGSFSETAMPLANVK